MKINILVLAMAGWVLAGCGNKGSSATQSAGTNSSLDYANTLVNAKKTADKTVDVAYLNQAVQLFNVQEGRFPKDLQELMPKYVTKIPDAPIGYKIDYNATSGEVKVVKQ